MKRILLFGLTIFIFSLCSPKRTFIIDHQEFKLELPAGTVQVEDNFFVDKYELSNHSYLEYLYWLSIVYGNTSKYLNAFPDDPEHWKNGFRHFINDSNDWEIDSNNYAPSVIIDSCSYLDLAVRYISYEQVMAYTIWRSDRVFEWILGQKGFLPIRSTKETDSSNYFSIERYFNGELEGIKPDFSIPYPHYRLPTRAEWEKIAQGFNNDEFGIDYENRKIKSAIKKGNNLFRCTYFDDETQKEIQYDIPDFVWNYPPNDYNIYNMIGTSAK